MYVVYEENSLVDMPWRELVDEIATLSAHLSAGMCRWLELVAEVDRREKLVACTTAQWLAWRCGLTPRTAREHVRVARCLEGLPVIREAFSRGELSFAKVRALTRIAEAGSEEELLRMAFAMTAAQLERAVRAYRRVTTEEAAALQDRAFFDWHWDEDGSLVLRGRLAPEDGALFVRALDAAHAVLREGGDGSAEPRQTNADAAAAMADLALSGADRTGGERHQVVVHVDEDALAGGGGGCELDEGPGVSAETARRLSCDGSVVELRERTGRPLSVGRKTRSVPPALRRALRRRDHGCRFPGCERQRFVDAHHIEHWARGGKTSLDNLVLLCRRHHRLVHEGGYGVERLPRGKLRFLDPDGAPVAVAPRPPPGSLGALLAHNREIDSSTYRSGYGDRMDLDLTVSAMLSARAP